MSQTDPKSELEIKSDADWKRQVKQEAAELDARRQRDASAGAETESGAAAAASEEDSPGAASRPEGPAVGQLPPADFTMLVTMFSTQAMACLGVLPNPETGKPEQNLPLARHFIDLLGVLQEKTRRNLTGHEADLLQNSLHELRLAYVELSRSPASSPPETGAATDSSA